MKLWYTWGEWLVSPKIGEKWVTFYGMELPWVGAFTEKWGSGYRNPVQNLGQKSKIHAKLGFPGLV